MSRTLPTPPPLPSASFEIAKVAGILTAYAPPEGLDARINAILPQLGALWLVDNSPNSVHAAYWRATYADNPAIHILENPANGLAKAQNMALAEILTYKENEINTQRGQQSEPHERSELARSSSAELHVPSNNSRKEGNQKTYDWALLLDDDSTSAPAMVARLLQHASILEGKEQGELAIIAPQLLDTKDGSRLPLPMPAHNLLGFKRAAAHAGRILRNPYYTYGSGTLLRLSAYERMGELFEPFGIYGVDMEYGLRLRAAGYQIHIVGDATMRHSLGNRTSVELLGKTISTTHHSAATRAQMIRNRRCLWHRYGRTFPAFARFDMLRWISEMVRVVMLEKNKLAKAKALLSY